MYCVSRGVLTHEEIELHVVVYNPSSQDEGRGGGGTLVFPCMRRLVIIVGGQNLEFQYFWGFTKNE